MEIIGISGKAGSGKDFVGREVLRPAGFHQWSFALPMKALVVGRGVSYDDAFHNKPPHVRELLQRVGTEEGWRQHGRRYWLDIAGAFLRFAEENLGLTRFYFSDVRFPHEVEWVRAQGGKVVRLELGDRDYPLAGTAAAEHESETALDGWSDWDARVVNDRDMTVDVIRRALEARGVIAPQSITSEYGELVLPRAIGKMTITAGPAGIVSWEEGT